MLSPEISYTLVDNTNKTINFDSFTQSAVAFHQGGRKYKLCTDGGLVDFDSVDEAVNDMIRDGERAHFNVYARTWAYDRRGEYTPTDEPLLEKASCQDVVEFLAEHILEISKAFLHYDTKNGRSAFYEFADHFHGTSQTYVIKKEFL